MVKWSGVFLISYFFLVNFTLAQSHKSLFKKGREAYEADNLEEALTFFDQAIEKNKTHTPISLQSKVRYCNYRGATHVRLGNYQKAISDLTYAIRNRKILEENQWVPYKIVSDHFWRGRAQLATGSASISLEDFDQVLTLDPNHGASHYWKGVALMDLERYNDAIKSFDKSLLNRYDEAASYSGKGVCYYRMQNFQQALGNYKRAFQLNNKDLSSLAGEALCNAHMGQYDSSIELIEGAILRNEGKDSYLFFQKARIEALYGNDEKVLENLEKSFGLGFNNWKSLGIYLSEFGAFAEDPRFIQLLIDNQAQIGLMGNSSFTSKMNEQRRQNLSYSELKANPTVKNTSSETKKSITTPAFVSDVDKNIPTTSKRNENYFAVVIGNENYNNEITVKYAINDAKSFKNYLMKTVGIPESNIHYVEDATYGQLLDEIDWITKIINAFQEEARIFFYYAGHGVPNDQTKDAFLLPTDGNSIRTNTAVSLNSLYASLGSGNASSVTVFLDACFSGSSREGMLTEGRGVRIKPKEETLDGKLVVFSAASGDQTAYPYSEKGHGLFTYFLLKKLQETEGEASYGELADYVKSKVNQRAVIINGKNQNPKVNTSSQFSDWQELKF